MGVQVWGGVQLEVERVFEKLMDSKDGKVMKTAPADHAALAYDGHVRSS